MMLYYLIQMLDDVPPDDKWLSAGEADILSKMRFHKRRSDWRLGRWTAKSMIVSYLNGIGERCSYPALEVRAAADGVPEAYLEKERLPLEISISHSMGRGFCVLSPDETALGCDLERVEPQDRDFLLDYFSREEAELSESMPHGDRPLYRTLIWSAKESALKSLREGLRRDTRSVVVELERRRNPLKWQKLQVHCTISDRDFSGWWRARESYVQTVTSGLASEEPVELEPGRTW
jgi:4'-phosphopantetheinyl transferase